MKTSLIAFVGFMLSLPALLAQEQATAKWNDPSRPGLLKVNSVLGSIRIKIHTTNDVTIEVKSRRNRIDDRIVRPPAPPEGAGLRRPDPGGSPFTVETDLNNVITVTGGDFASGMGDLEIEVPNKTNLNLQAKLGTIMVDGVEGDIEETSLNGSINLTNVSGSVGAHSMNGTMLVSFQNIADGKPMSFTSMNGNVDVTLPAAAKANLKMRTALGGIYTDFDVQLATSSTNSTQDQPRLRRIRGEREVSGSINGGGADFDLRSQNGNVYLRKAK